MSELDGGTTAGPSSRGLVQAARPPVRESHPESWIETACKRIVMTSRRPNLMRIFSAMNSTNARAASLLSLMLFAGGVAAQDKENPIVMEDVFDFPTHETFATGIVYGPKAAFKISAPSGWVVDNRAGVSKACRACSIPKAQPGLTQTR